MKAATAVLGMHRSGTSAMAGALASMGLQPGQELIPADTFNQRGYFENSRAVAVNDAILASMQRSWDDPRESSLDLLPPEILNRFHEQVDEIIVSQWPLTTTPLIKDPRLSRLLPIWRTAFQRRGLDLYAIIMLRHPADVAASLMSRDQLHPRKAALLYCAYLLDAERFSRNLRRRFVRYSDLIDSPGTILEELRADLSLQFLPNVQKPTLTGTPDTKISANLAHHRAPETFRPDNDDIALAVRVYGALDGNVHHSIPEHLDELRHELSHRIAALEPWLGESMQRTRERCQFFAPGDSATALTSGLLTATVYWRAKSRGYDETNSTSHRLKIGAAGNIVRFPIDPQDRPIDSLRIDPCNFPLFVRIHDLRVVSPNGSERWSATTRGFKDLALMQQVMPISPPEKAPFEFIATGDDPHFEISLPSSLLADIESGWAVEMNLEVDFVASPSTFAALSHQLARRTLIERQHGGLETPNFAGASTRIFKDARLDAKARILRILGDTGVNQ